MGQKVRKNFEFFTISRFYVHIPETIKIEAYKQHGKKLYLSPIQLSDVYGPIADGVLQGETKSERRNTSFAAYAYSNSAVYRFCFP